MTVDIHLGDPPDGEWLDTREVFRRLHEHTRLRAAIAAAIVDLNGAHYLNGRGDLCAVCGPADGSWPCVTRMVADDLRAALDPKEGLR